MLADEQGEPFRMPFEARMLVDLPSDASAEQLLGYAFLANAELEQRYWEWRSALEQIPQDASPNTTLAVSVSQMLSGNFATALAAANDPMFNIPLQSKLATAGRRALELARATGQRFQKAKFDLQAKVLIAYADWSLLAELARLEETNLRLLDTGIALADQRVRVGTAPQQDLLKMQTERDLAGRRLETLRAKVPGQRALLNALLSRKSDAPLEPPQALPASRPLALGDDELLSLLVHNNPELAALAQDLKGRREAINLARLQYLPDFALSFSTDLGAQAQSVIGMLTLPILRLEAIEAGIAQSRADLRATEAMRRQVANDLEAKAVFNIYALRNAERQTDLFERTLLPRAERVVHLLRESYSVGKVPLVELLDSQRMLIETRKAIAELRNERERLLAELEALAALPISRSAAGHKEKP